MMTDDGYIGGGALTNDDYTDPTLAAEDYILPSLVSADAYAEPTMTPEAFVGENE